MTDKMKLPIQLEDDTLHMKMKGGNIVSNTEKTIVVSRTPSTDSVVKLATRGKRGTERDRIVKKLNLLKYIIGTVGGKDKLAKVIKCIFDLIKVCLTSLPSSSSSSSSFGSSRSTVKYILQRILQNGITLASASWVSQQLGTFRYALRFGGTPFRVNNFINKYIMTMVESIQKGTIPDWKKSIVNETFLQDCIDIYYGIFDELNFLYKMKLLTNQRFHKFVNKHEAIAWEYDIMLGLKKNRDLLHANRRRQLELSIRLNTHELTATDSLISKQLQRDLKIDHELSKLYDLAGKLSTEQQYIKMDIARLTLDLVANSTDLFQWSRYLPRATYASLSLLSGCIGLAKFYNVSKDKLTQEQEKKQ